MNYSGKSILIVGGGLLQVPAVHIAHELGLRVVITDKNPGCACASLADRFVALDTKDALAHAALAFELKMRDHLAAVFTEGASVEYTVALAAETAGLPGIPAAVAERIANKGRSRECLTNAGIPQPKFAIALSYQDAVAEAKRIGFPAVIKAPDNSGSRGLTKLYAPEQLTFQVYDRARAASGDYTVVVEELLEPFNATWPESSEIAEQSVETVWHNGEGHWLNWVDRPFLPQVSYAIERGHINPAQHPAIVQQCVESMVLAAGQALGMTTGIFKCDIMLTTKGPRILETTARLSGGFDAQYTSPLAHGVNYIRGAMRLALGEGADTASDRMGTATHPYQWDDFVPCWRRHAVALSAFPKPGRITAIVGLEEAARVAGVKHVLCRMRMGDVIAPYTTCVERPLFVIADGKSRREAVGAAEKALEMIKIETAPTLPSPALQGRGQ